MATYSSLFWYKPNASFVLPGVFQDAAPQPTTKEDTRLINNIHPYKVCLKILSVIFNYGYGKIKTLKKETMDLPDLREHGLKNKPCNLKMNKGTLQRD